MQFKKPASWLIGVLAVIRMTIVAGLYTPSMAPSLMNPISTFADPTVSPPVSPDPKVSSDLTSASADLMASSAGSNVDPINSLSSFADPGASSADQKVTLANPIDSVTTPNALSTDAIQNNCGETKSVYEKAPATDSFSDDISFSPGSELYSCSGVFRLTYQNDGNIVLYHTPSSHAIWQESATNGVYQFYHHNDPDRTAKAPARLMLQNDGNLIVKLDTESGSETVVWSSETQGTDCTKAFVTDKAKETLALNMETVNTLAASVARDDICSLFNIRVYQTIASIQDINVDSTQNRVAKRSIPRGRSVVNTYKFGWTIDKDKFAEPIIPIGEARMAKTFYFDGTRVSNGAEGEPERANLEGEPSPLAQISGLVFFGESLGSEKELWSTFNGEGRGAHYSSRRAMWRWETPNGMLIPLQSDPVWQHEFSIKGFANGSVLCDGGDCEDVPVP